MRQLVNDAGLGEGKRTAQEPLSQYADLLGVEAVETADGLDAPIQVRVGHYFPLQLPIPKGTRDMSLHVNVN
jgi:hypothetical protein